MYNRAILIGRLTADPELKQTQSGISVCSFSIAVDRAYSGRGGERQTDFINIVPGWPKIISWTVAEHKKPVIAAGNVCDKQSILDSLSAGAIAICSTNHSVWEL